MKLIAAKILGKLLNDFGLFFLKIVVLSYTVDQSRQPMRSLIEKAQNFFPKIVLPFRK